VGNYQPIAKALWTLANSGLSTTLTASGDSTNAGTLGPIDLHDVCDLVLSVVTGASAGTNPSLTVQVDMQDASGNWLPAVITTAAITTAKTTVVYGGLHMPGTPVVLTGRGRVTWTVLGTAGPAWPVSISLAGR